MVSSLISAFVSGGTGPVQPTNWTSLPLELRQLILEFLTQQTSGWGACATVNKEWQNILEKESFRRLKLGVRCLDEMPTIVGPRQAKLTRQVWLNIELPQYTCRDCDGMETSTEMEHNRNFVRNAIGRLFSILAQWPVVEGAELSLELSIQSPSDRQHRFKNLYFGGHGENEELHSSSSVQDWLTVNANHPWDDANHGWVNGRQMDASTFGECQRIFELRPLSFSSQDDVPLVKAVTKFIFRRQCRRQIDPKALGYLFNRLPRLQSVVYEPWQRSLLMLEGFYDSYLDTIKYHLPRSLKRVSIFENTDKCISKAHRWLKPLTSGVWRSDMPILGCIFAKRSLDFEKLSVAFLIDSNDFFQSCQQEWIWEHLSLLCLTTRTLTQTNHPDIIASTLKSAAAAALLMPCLHTMTLWNSVQSEACKFIYGAESGSTSVSWKGTWNLYMEPSIIHDWQKVAQKYTRYNLQIIQEPEILVQVESRSHAVELLEFPAEVIDPISLLQMRKEEQFGQH